MVFKVLVIGVIVFVPRDLQLPFVFLVTLAFLVGSNSVQPYTATKDNSFEYASLPPLNYDANRL